MLPFFVIVPIIVGVFLYVFPFEKFARVVSIVVQFGFTVATFYLFYRSQTEEIITSIGAYEGTMGITLRVDTLSAAFMVLTSFIFLMAAVYSYSDNKSRLFWFLLFLWEASLVGLFLTGDLFNIFVLSEVGTIVISTLVLYIRKKRSLLDGMIYLMANVVVMQFYVFGLGYVYMLTGALDIPAVTYALGQLDESQLILPYALIMTFVAFKCALVPVFSWLPKAHSTPGAPPAVSAVLSGLHIKSGVYIFLRVQEIFAPIAVTDFFLVIGLITAIFGVVVALAQTHIKLVLAYSTIAQIGLIFVGLNFGDSYNYTGSMFHIFNHAFFKTALFMGAGVIVKAYGIKDITKIKGVFWRMPLVGVSLGAAMLGIVGAPLFSGSISKYFLMSGVYGPLYFVMVIINLGSIMVFIKFVPMFFGKHESIKHKTGEHVVNARIKHNFWHEIPIVILGGVSLALGIFGEQFISIMFDVDKNVTLMGYVEKTVIFFVSLGVGVLIFRRFINNNPALKKIRQPFKLNFKQMVAAMGVFFAMIIIVIGV